MKYSFSDYLQYLSESIDVKHDFSEEMYEKLKSMKLAFNGTDGFFYINIISNSKVSKIIVIIPTDNEKEVELRIYNYKVDEDNLYLEDKILKIDQLGKIKDIDNALSSLVNVESDFINMWNK